MDQPPAPRSAGEMWAQFPQDPRDPACAALRASDADRDRVQQVLSDAFADGRLDRDEYDERSSAALQSRTLGALPPLLGDLLPERPVAARTPATRPLIDATPADLEQRAHDKFLDARRGALLGFLGPTLICWVIWFLTSFDNGFHPYWPWPVFPTVFTAVNLVRVVANRRSIETDELHELQERQRTALQSRDLQSRDQQPD